jgi:hypothetical protein
MRQGAFSEIEGLTLFDPRTGTANGSGRQAFLNNTIPASRFNAFTSQLVPFFPDPNLPGIENNLLAYAPLRNDNHRPGGRIDVAVGDNTNLFLNYRYGTYFVSDASPLGNTLGSNAEGRLKTHNAYAALSHMFSQSLVTEARIGYNRYRNLMNSVNSANPLFGLPLGNLGGATLPTFRLGDFTSIGAGEGLPIRAVDNTYQAGNNWALTMGKHSFKFGWDVQHFRVSGFSGLWPGARQFRRGNRV